MELTTKSRLVSFDQESGKESCNTACIPGLISRRHGLCCEAAELE